MMNRPNPTLIGLFVLSALALGIVAIMFVGGRGFSEQSVLIVPKVLAVYTAFHGYDKRTA